MDIKNLQNSTFEGNASHSEPVSYSLWEVITIATVSAIVSLVTVVGNMLVMLSFKVNSQLKTVNNYYLLSLAFADLIIGVLSMNLYTSYILMGYWALGNLACDLWLALDYVASNASVMNLLVISFDRYFSVTRPLTYRAKRTPRRAGVLIGLAWLVSFVLWAPPILCWQYLMGERTVLPNQCQIPFFSVPVITFGTAIAAFYVPVSVMTFLYWRIYRETERRTKDLTELQGLAPAGGSAPPDAAVRRSCFGECRDRKQASWSSSTQSNATRSTACSDGAWAKEDRVASFSYTSSEEEELRVATPTSCPPRLPTSSLRGQRQDGRGQQGDEEAGYFTSPQKKSSRKCISYKFTPKAKGRSLTQEVSQGAEAPPTFPSDPQQTALSSSPASSASPRPLDSALKSQMTKRKRMVLIKEKKAAQTLSAILLAFILTWTPYNIMVLVSTFCPDCVPLSLWQLGYWLCYVNSTVNPMCYALCNKTFQKTFRMLLLCQGGRRRAEDKLHWLGQSTTINSKST